MYELSSVITKDALAFNTDMGFVQPGAGMRGMLSYQSKKKLEAYKNPQGFYVGYKMQRPVGPQYDRFFLLSESVEASRPNVLGGVTPQVHELLILRADGTVFKGKYSERNTRDSYEKCAAEWQRVEALPYTGLLSDYVTKHTQKSTFELFVQEVHPEWTDLFRT